MFPILCSTSFYYHTEAVRFSPEQKETLKSLQEAFAKERLNDYVIAVFSKPTSGQMTSPENMKADWNEAFTEFIGSIDDRWGISPHPDISVPDHPEVHRNLLTKIKKLINDTPGVYNNSDFANARKKYKNAQRKKEAAEKKERKQYEENLQKLGAEAATAIHDRNLEAIKRDHQRDLMLACGKGACSVLAFAIIRNPALLRGVLEFFK